ncbi:MAG TPA: rod shape-determining protein [Candidatus Alectryocaccobium stercorigallinarum]|nr:rod shape-determining protein [Candidatus Alectryocaccobium stercorigallinarum]
MAYATDIGIDLGTSNVVVYIKGKGIVLKEPAVIAYDRDAEKIKAFGEEARQMIGRTPGNIAGIRPLKEGIISDYVMTEELLKYFIQKAMGNRGFLKLRIVISIPTRVTDVEKRAVEEAAYLAGAREVTLVANPVASAIGSGIDITLPYGTLVVDVGGGVADIAIVSLGGIAAASCVPAGGNQFTESIIRYLRKTHLMFIGEQTAEAVKIRIGTVSKNGKNKSMEIKGRNVFTGLPSRILVTSEELSGALSEIAESLADSVCGVIEQATPELANDVARRGIILTGGGALLKGLDEVIKKKTGIETIIAEKPDCTVALGTGRYLELKGRYE